jgi:chromosome segregation ATPase
MGPAANVQSIAALETYRAALAEFAVKASDTLAGAEITIRRNMDHLRERHRFWIREHQKRQEELNRVRSALSLARAMKETGRARAGELEIDLRKAMRRVREAEEKIETCARWLRTLPDALRDYEGPARKLQGFLESDVQQALGMLENKVRSLEAYLATAMPAGGNLASGLASPAPAAAEAPAATIPSEGGQA